MNNIAGFCVGAVLATFLVFSGTTTYENHVAHKSLDQKISQGVSLDIHNGDKEIVIAPKNKAIKNKIIKSFQDEDFIYLVYLQEVTCTTSKNVYTHLGKGWKVKFKDPLNQKRNLFISKDGKAESISNQVLREYRSWSDNEQY